MNAPPECARATLSWVKSLFAALVVGVGLMLPPEGIPYITMCWFYSLTGLPCPACGLTRSFTAIVHGDFARAWRMNPFGYVAFAVALFFLFGPLLRRFFPKMEDGLGKRRVLLLFLPTTLCALFLFGLIRVCVAWRPELAGILPFALESAP